MKSKTQVEIATLESVMAFIDGKAKEIKQRTAYREGVVTGLRWAYLHCSERVRSLSSKKRSPKS